MNELVTLESQQNYRDILRKTKFGQSAYSDENFMVKEQLTPHRQLRQVLMQYDGICYSLLTSQNKQETARIEKEELLNKINELQDAINRNMTLPTKLEVEREMTDFDRKSYELRIKKLYTKIKEKEIGEAQSYKLFEDALETKKSYEKILNELIPQVEKLESEGIDFEEAEKIYWKRRFTEEAKLDIFIKQNGIPIDKETIKAIFRLDDNTMRETFIGLGIPENITEALGLNFKDDDTKLINNEPINMIEEN